MEQPQLLRNPIFIDNRGVFAPLTFEKKNDVEYVNKTWIQSNLSVNPNKWTIRGLHYQKEPFAQSKLVKVITGRIIDFVVDIRTDSEDLGKCYVYDVKPDYELYVPKGFAHGFMTLEYNTIVQYLVDEKYSKESEGSIFWESVEEIKNALPVTFKKEFSKISEKDVNCETLEEFLKKINYV